MRFEQFREKVKTFPLLSVEYLKLIFPYNQQFKNQLGHWRQAKRIIRLRKNFYILNPENRRIYPSRMYIASELYKPSYISLEYALSFYDLIPEKVTDITSLSTRKTYQIQNDLGRFAYQHIQERCFTGFTQMRDEAGLPYFFAVPEKAVVDFVYFHLPQFAVEVPTRDVLRVAFRFQNVDTLDTNKMQEYASLFQSKKLEKVIGQVKK